MTVLNEYRTPPRATPFGRLGSIALQVGSVVSLAALLAIVVLDVDVGSALEEWRTGVLFLSSAILIVAFQTYFQQLASYQSEARALVESLNADIAKNSAFLAEVADNRNGRR